MDRSTLLLILFLLLAMVASAGLMFGSGPLDPSGMSSATFESDTEAAASETAVLTRSCIPAAISEYDIPPRIESTVPAAEQPQPLARCIRGRTIDTKGVPISGTEVTGLCGDQADMTTSATDGSFELHLSVADGHCFSLTLAHASHAPTGLRSYCDGTNPEVNVGAITLRPGARIRGRVLSPLGTLEGVNVVLSAAKSGVADSPPFVAARTEVDPNGCFEFDRVRPGDYRIAASGKSLTGEAQVSAHEGELTTCNLTLCLSRVLRGRIFGRGGWPIAGAIVRIRSSYRSGERILHSDENGLFENSYGECAVLEIIVEANGYRRHVQELRQPPTSLEIHLKPVLRIEGVAVDATTGRPVENLGLQLLATTPSRGGEAASHVVVPVPGPDIDSHPAGRFQLTIPDSGDYTLIVRAFGYAAHVTERIAVAEGRDSVSVVRAHSRLPCEWPCGRPTHPWLALPRYAHKR